jgi:hypothetical protein
MAWAAKTSKKERTVKRANERQFTVEKYRGTVKEKIRAKVGMIDEQIDDWWNRCILSLDRKQRV